MNFYSKGTDDFKSPGTTGLATNFNPRENLNEWGAGSHACDKLATRVNNSGNGSAHESLFQHGFSINYTVKVGSGLAFLKSFLRVSAQLHMCKHA
jgi:hypothetical protein